MGGWSLHVVAMLGAAFMAVAVANWPKCTNATDSEEGCLVYSVTGPNPAKFCQMLNLCPPESTFYLKTRANISKIIIVIELEEDKSPGNIHVTGSHFNDPDKWYNITLVTERLPNETSVTYSVFVDQISAVQELVQSPNLAHCYSVYTTNLPSYARNSSQCPPPPASPSPQSSTQGQADQSVAVTASGDLPTTPPPSERDWRHWYIAVILAGAAVVITLMLLAVWRRKCASARNHSSATASHPQDHHASEHIYEDITEHSTDKGVNGQGSVCEGSGAQRGSLNLSINSIYVPFEMAQ